MKCRYKLIGHTLLWDQWWLRYDQVHRTCSRQNSQVRDSNFLVPDVGRAICSGLNSCQETLQVEYDNMKGNIHAWHFSVIFTSRVSGRGNRIGLVCVCVCETYVDVVVHHLVSTGLHGHREWNDCQVFEREVCQCWGLSIAFIMDHHIISFKVYISRQLDVKDL